MRNRQRQIQEERAAPVTPDKFQRRFDEQIMRVPAPPPVAILQNLNPPSVPPQMVRIMTVRVIMPQVAEEFGGCLWFTTPLLWYNRRGGRGNR